MTKRAQFFFLAPWDDACVHHTMSSRQVESELYQTHLTLSNSPVVVFAFNDALQPTKGF
jgi:hypothetical protein